MPTTLNRIGYPAHKALIAQGRDWVERQIAQAVGVSTMPRITTVESERLREASRCRLSKLLLARADFNGRELFDARQRARTAP